MVKTPDVNAPAADAVPTAVTLTTLFGEREFAWDKAIYFLPVSKAFLITTSLHWQVSPATGPMPLS